MTEHKFTDDEIIRALKTIDDIGDCSRDCIFYDGKVHHCASVFAHYALDLINRQKANLQEVITLNSKLEAELAELQSENKILKDSNINLQELYQNEKEKVAKAKQKVIDIGKALQSAKAEIERIHRHTEMYHEVRAEAIKEFAERLKERGYTNNYCQDIVLVESIDNLVKEMTEGKE